MHRTLPAVAGVVLAAVVPAADALAAPYASRTLREGSSGSDVRALQRNLDRAGEETAADGEFGPATESSLRAFEAAEDRRVNGVATRSDQRLVRKRAAGSARAGRDDAAARPRSAPDGLAVPPADAPEEVGEIIEAGNEIAAQALQVRWRARPLARHRLRLLRLRELRPARGGAARLRRSTRPRSRAGASAAAASGSRSGPTRATPTWSWRGCASTRAPASAAPRAGPRRCARRAATSHATPLASRRWAIRCKCRGLQHRLGTVVAVDETAASLKLRVRNARVRRPGDRSM